MVISFMLVDDGVRWPLSEEISFGLTLAILDELGYVFCVYDVGEPVSTTTAGEVDKYSERFSSM